MTTTTQTHGGGAQPASIDTSGKVTGGAALRVYGFDSEADAIAAGYVCEGGPAMSVALITDAQLASGAWRLEGDPSGTAVYTAPSNMPVEGGFAVPIYPVNGWGSTPNVVGIGDILRSAAVAYWRFEEADNTARVDSKNGISLTSHNPTIQVVGKIGNAYRADGANNGYVDIATSPAGLSANGKLLYFTVWIKVTDSTNYPVITKTRQPNFHSEYGISQVGTLAVFGDLDFAETSPVPADGNFHFIEAVIDARTSAPVYYISLDHAAFVSAIGTTPINSANELFEVGAANEFTGNQNIDIDELGIFELSNLPTSAQRDYLWNNGAGRALFPAP